MALQRIWIGSIGPYLYDDSAPYPNESGIFVRGVRSTGQLQIDEAADPTIDEHVIRVKDLTGTGIGDIVVPIGYRLKFLGTPSYEMLWDGTYLVHIVGGVVVRRTQP